MGATAEDISSLNEDSYLTTGLRAFTFWITETLYAIDISKVLTISQDLDNIQNIPTKAKGLLGMTEFQGHAIPVIDFANLLDLKSGTEASHELIQLFTDKENEHHDWLNALEKSIVDGSPFTKAKDPHQCAFGKWYNQFETRDESLEIIMKDFDEPHRRIHALADKLLSMKVDGQTKEALKILSLERDITMKRLSRHFAHAKEQVSDSSRQVLLYITEDGFTPTIALRIDEIHDVIDFKPEQFKPMTTLKAIFQGDESKLITNYMKLDKTSDCLLINASKIHEVVKEFV
ncbi:MAG: CZB domain-containing protein [Gammaproteobacteria bacterium]|nr:CZB domain-containing protein [Gammaproteobacteria bacterium]